MTSDSGPETFFRILADLGQVTSEGMVAGTGAKRLEMTPLQLVRLMQVLDDAAAVEALGLALHYGEIRLDPFRVEVLGWGRDWLIGKGMAPSPARRAAKRLGDLGMIETVPRPGARGAEGKKLAVVSGNQFGLAELDLTPIRWRPAPVGTAGSVVESVVESAAGSPPGQKVTNRPDEDTNTQVSAVGQDLANCGTGPVDNPGSAVGQDLANCDPADGRLVTQRPSVSVNAQVSSVGQSVTDRSSTPATRSRREEDLLLPRPDADGALARADLHAFLRDARVRAALGARQESARLALAEVFAGNREATAQAVEFLDCADGGPAAMALARFVVDLLLLDGAEAVETATVLSTLLKARGTHLPPQTSEQFLTGLVLALALAMDAPIRSWPGFVVHVAKASVWHRSVGLSSLLATVYRVTVPPRRVVAVDEVAADGAEDGRPQAADARGSAGPVFGSPARNVFGRPPVAETQRSGAQARGDRSRDDSSEPRPARRDPLAVLRAAVAGTKWEDPVEFDKVVGDFRLRAQVLKEWEERQAASGA